MEWMVYILKCGDGSLYTGITNDFKKRLSSHISGTGAKYTRNRGPFICVYKEDCKNRSIASKRELEIKKLSRADKLKLIS